MLLDIKTLGPGASRQAHRPGNRPDARLRPAAGRASQARLGAFRARARVDRRSGRHRAGIARFAASLGNVERVDVLPFHQMGRFKWETLGIRYALQDTEPPTAEATERACAIFRAEGLKAD